MSTTNSTTQHSTNQMGNPTGNPLGNPLENPLGNPDSTLGQGSIVEAQPLNNPRRAHESTKDMFLSPRVLDAGAFTRYSEMLKSIITQASAQGRTLEDFSADAEAMVKRCDVTSEAINKRMQAGLRMIKMIDERAHRTDELLDRVSAAQPDSQAIAAQLDKIIEQRLAKAQRQIDEIANNAQARVLEADQQVQAAQERTREAIALSDGHANKLAELTSRMDNQLQELDARIHNTREETNTTLTGILDRAAVVTQGLNSTIEQVLSRAHESGSNLALKIDEASMLTEARIIELNTSIEPILEASQQVMRTLGMDPEKPVFEDSPLARIEQLVDRGEVQLASLDRVYRQQEDLQSQAEGVKAVFGVWLVEAAEDLDVLEERKTHIVGPISTALEQIKELSPDLESNLELASTKLTHLQIEQQALRQTIQASTTVASEVSLRMTNESGQLQALLDGSLHKLSTRVEQAGVWLGALIQHAETLGSTLPGAGQMNFGTQPTPEPTPVPAQAPAPAPVQAPVQTPAPSVQAHATIIESTPEPQVIAQPQQPQAVVETKAPTIISPLPPCLPIDAFTFDGSPTVIMHRNEPK